MNLQRPHQLWLVFLLAARSWMLSSTLAPLTTALGSQGRAYQQQHQGRWSVGSSTKASATPVSTTTDASSQAPSAASSSASNGDEPDGSTLSLFSPCKINLFLRILGKRDDGYHDLASLFQAVGFGDTLELALLPEGAAGAGDNDGDDGTGEKDDSSDDSADVFTCNMEGVPTDSRNLVVRALELMRARTGLPRYFRANLVKQVPAQAGLGGGSANAATAMWGANELLGRPATLEQMVEWSADLGSDITFFLSRGTAYCTGRGEIMSGVDPPLPSGTKLCIVKPDIGLSTPAVFRALDHGELSELDPDKTLLPSFLETRPIDAVPVEHFVNDLEPPAFRCVPELKSLKDELLQVEGFRRVMMSGSGTSIFCLGEPDDVEGFRKEFGQREGLQVFFSEFISRPEGSWFERPNEE